MTPVDDRYTFDAPLVQETGSSGSLGLCMDDLIGYLKEKVSQFDSVTEKEIVLACLGRSDITVDIQKQLFQETLLKQPPILQDVIQRIYTNHHKNPKGFFDVMMLQSQSLIKEGYPAAGRDLEECAIRWRIAPAVLKFAQVKSVENLEACIASCNQVRLERQLPAVEKTVRTSLSELFWEAAPKNAKREGVDGLVQKVFENAREQLLPISGTSEDNLVLDLKVDPLRRNGKGPKPSTIWLHRARGFEGIRSIYIRDPEHMQQRKDGLRETLVKEIYIPFFNSGAHKQSKAQLSRILYYPEVGAIEQQQIKHQVALQASTQYFTPLPITNLELGYVKKTDGCTSLEREFKRVYRSLSNLKLVKVLKDLVQGVKVLSEKLEAVSLDIAPENVALQEDDEGNIRGMLDHFLHLCRPGAIKPSTAPNLNVLAQKGHASFETDRYGLILLLEKAFSCEDKSIGIADDLVRKKGLWDPLQIKLQMLTGLARMVHDPHCLKVQELCNRYGDLGYPFSKELLEYVEEMRRAGVESYQTSALEEFAFKTAMFTQVSPLLQRAFQANANHLSLRGSGKPYAEILQQEPTIPTLEEIEAVLVVGEHMLQQLQKDLEAAKVPTSYPEISKQDIAQIIELAFPKLDYFEKGNCARRLRTILTEYLKREPSIGSEIRLRRDKTYWKDCDVKSPLSLRARMRENGMNLKIIFSKQYLGKGASKKVLSGIEVELLQGVPPRITPLTTQRILDGANTWSESYQQADKLHEKIMASDPVIAKRYVLPPPEKHAIYQSGDKQKMEITAPPFVSNLWDVFDRGYMDTGSKRLNLTMKHALYLLKDALKAIEWVSGKGYVHGDVRLENIAAVLEKDKSGVLRLNSRLYDFGLVSRQGEYFYPKEYWIWNSIRREYGVPTKETDLYGAMLAIADALLPHFSDLIKGTDQQVLQTLEKVQQEPLRTRRELLDKHRQKMNIAFSFLPKEALDWLFEEPALESMRSLSKEEQIEAFERKKLEAIEFLFKGPVMRGPDGEVRKRLLSQLVFFERVFSLLMKVLDADQLSKSSMQGYSVSMDDVQSCLSRSGFPSAAEMIGVLSECEKISEMINEKVSSAT